MQKAAAVPGYHLEVGSDRIAILSFDLPGKVNVMNDNFMAAMDMVMSTLEREQAKLSGLILTSAKSSFFAGGDLAMMLRSEPGQEEFLTSHFDRLKGYFRRLEKLSIPVVAAINGLALGGGYELCLACHHRIALRNGKTQVGLPEVQFGILPAAGGVVRLTRKLGLDRALPFLLSGTRVDVGTALREGLVDEVADTVEDLVAKARAWILANPHPVQPWDRKPVADESRHAAEHRLPPGIEMDGDNDAVAEIVAIARLALKDDVDAVLAAETRGFVRLVLSPNAKRRIGDFFKGARAAAKRPEERQAA